MMKIKIIAGSTRPGRFNIQPANWIYNIAKERKDAEVELLDLAEINLPLLDEPIPPSQGKYSKEHTKKWADKIREADGFIIVSPEYNHGIPAALKNAIDFLFAEWHYKPVSFISYGSLAGGARAVEHLRGVAGEVKMYDLREQILFPNYWDNMNDEGEYQFSDQHIKAANQMIHDTVFWAGQMKRARQEMK